jgi:predicted amidohydrolase
MRNITIAAACVRSVVGDSEGNLARVAEMAESGAGQGAELILFPEACLTGYAIGPGAGEAAAEINGRLLDGAAQMAARVGVDLSLGLMERTEDGGLYLTQVLLSREGNLAGIYRKTHLGPTEKKLFSPGQGNGIVDLGYARLGQQLCFDAHFPELSLIQADKGAELILAAHASPKKEPAEKKLERWLRYLAARAYDNTVFVAACNPVGDNGQGWSFSGTALILGPKGEVLASYAGDRPGLALAELDPRDLERIATSRMGHFRANRRPGLYKRLVEES